MSALNFIFDIFGQLFDLIFFTDLGGINIATVVGGMVVAMLALKLLRLLLERS